MTQDPLRDARAAYARGDNVLRTLRDVEGTNQPDAVLLAYDLQSGSYRRALEDPAMKARFDRYNGAIARVLGELDFDSMLEAGVGEATTLVPVLAMLRQPRHVAGFDISWSRIAHARAFARGRDLDLFVGDLFKTPIADDAFDLVWTSHALEPNRGRERAGIAELARITRRWVVLFEPSYELGSDATRAHMEEHAYIRGLPAAAEALGLAVVRHELVPETKSANNQTAVLVLRKETSGPPPEDWRACPRCHGKLTMVKDALFCAEEGLVYPVLDGIPCLDERNAVIASAFADEL